jgi:sugar/nucleoside kinase (ribokinase family)
MLDGIDHFHFGYPPLMKKMYEQDGAELRDLLEKVKRSGATTSLDMAAVDPNSPAGRADWKKILQKVLPLVDFFVPSAEEICFMLDRQRYDQWNARSKGGDITNFLNVEEDIKPLADELIKMGTKVVLIKCGALGIYYKTSGEISGLCHALGLNPREWSGIEGFEESFLQENVVSATGAGDTSIAAFLTSMLSGYSLKRCVQLAAATGACCISSYDALSGLEPLDVLWDRIEAGWAKRPAQ